MLLKDLLRLTYLLTPLKYQHIHKQRRETRFSVTKVMSFYRFDGLTEEIAEL